MPRKPKRGRLPVLHFTARDYFHFSAAKSDGLCIRTIAEIDFVTFERSACIRRYGKAIAGNEANGEGSPLDL
jgi:hypothetical protein